LPFLDGRTVVEYRVPGIVKVAPVLPGCIPQDQLDGLRVFEIDRRLGRPEFARQVAVDGPVGLQVAHAAQHGVYLPNQAAAGSVGFGFDNARGPPRIIGRQRLPHRNDGQQGRDCEQKRKGESPDQMRDVRRTPCELAILGCVLSTVNQRTVLLPQRFRTAAKPIFFYVPDTHSVYLRTWIFNITNQ
jgi:hypothetical protein